MFSTRNRSFTHEKGTSKDYLKNYIRQHYIINHLINLLNVSVKTSIIIIDS